MNHSMWKTLDREQRITELLSNLKWLEQASDLKEVEVVTVLEKYPHLPSQLDIDHLLTPNVRLRVLTTTPRFFYHLANPTEEESKIALRQMPHLIRWIDNPSEELQTIAVKSDPKLYKAIENPHINVTALVTMLNLAKEEINNDRK